MNIIPIIERIITGNPNTKPVMKAKLVMTPETNTRLNVC